MPEDEERAYIADCVARFRKLTGRQLRGWFSPGVSYTQRTLDLVAEAGFTYSADLYHDDHPTPLKVRSGSLLSVPHSMDLNDAVLYRYDAEGEEFARWIIDHFDTVWREGADIPRVMCIALHPYMMGQPHRIRHLDRARPHHGARWRLAGDNRRDRGLGPAAAGSGGVRHEPIATHA
jgi:allantoinase